MYLSELIQLAMTDPVAKVQDCQNMFSKLAKLPRLEPAIFQVLLQLISLSLTLIQEDGGPENGIDLLWNFNHFLRN